MPPRRRSEMFGTDAPGAVLGDIMDDLVAPRTDRAMRQAAQAARVGRLPRQQPLVKLERDYWRTLERRFGSARITRWEDDREDAITAAEAVPGSELWRGLQAPFPQPFAVRPMEIIGGAAFAEAGSYRHDRFAQAAQRPDGVVYEYLAKNVAGALGLKLELSRYLMHEDVQLKLDERGMAIKYMRYCNVAYYLRTNTFAIAGADVHAGNGRSARQLGIYHTFSNPIVRVTGRVATETKKRAYAARNPTAPDEQQAYMLERYLVSYEMRDEDPLVEEVFGHVETEMALWLIFVDPTGEQYDFQARRPRVDNVLRDIYAIARLVWTFRVPPGGSYSEVTTDKLYAAYEDRMAHPIFYELWQSQVTMRRNDGKTTLDLDLSFTSLLYTLRTAKKTSLEDTHLPPSESLVDYLLKTHAVRENLEDFNHIYRYVDVLRRADERELRELYDKTRPRLQYYPGLGVAGQSYLMAHPDSQLRGRFSPIPLGAAGVRASDLQAVRVLLETGEEGALLDSVKQLPVLALAAEERKRRLEEERVRRQEEEERRRREREAYEKQQRELAEQRRREEDARREKLRQEELARKEAERQAEELQKRRAEEAAQIREKEEREQKEAEERRQREAEEERRRVEEERRRKEEEALDVCRQKEEEERQARQEELSLPQSPPPETPPSVPLAQEMPFDITPEPPSPVEPASPEQEFEPVVVPDYADVTDLGKAALATIDTMMKLRRDGAVFDDAIRFKPGEEAQYNAMDTQLRKWLREVPFAERAVHREILDKLLSLFELAKARRFVNNLGKNGYDARDVLFVAETVVSHLHGMRQAARILHDIFQRHESLKTKDEYYSLRARVYGDGKTSMARKRERANVFFRVIEDLMRNSRGSFKAVKYRFLKRIMEAEPRAQLPACDAKAMIILDRASGNDRIGPMLFSASSLQKFWGEDGTTRVGLKRKDPQYFAKMGAIMADLCAPENTRQLFTEEAVESGGCDSVFEIAYRKWFELGLAEMRKQLRIMVEEYVVATVTIRMTHEGSIEENQLRIDYLNELILGIAGEKGRDALYYFFSPVAEKVAKTMESRPFTPDYMDQYIEMFTQELDKSMRARTVGFSKATAKRVFFPYKVWLENFVDKYITFRRKKYDVPVYLRSDINRANRAAMFVAILQKGREAARYFNLNERFRSGPSVVYFLQEAGQELGLYIPNARTPPLKLTYKVFEWKVLLGNQLATLFRLLMLLGYTWTHDGMRIDLDAVRALSDNNIPWAQSRALLAEMLHKTLAFEMDLVMWVWYTQLVFLHADRDSYSFSAADWKEMESMYGVVPDNLYNVFEGQRNLSIWKFRLENLLSRLAGDQGRQPFPARLPRNVTHEMIYEEMQRVVTSDARSGEMFLSYEMATTPRLGTEIDAETPELVKEASSAEWSQELPLTPRVDYRNLEVTSAVDDIEEPGGASATGSVGDDVPESVKRLDEVLRAAVDRSEEEPMENVRRNLESEFEEVADTPDAAGRGARLAELRELVDVILDKRDSLEKMLIKSDMGRSIMGNLRGMMDQMLRDTGFAIADLEWKDFSRAAGSYWLSHYSVAILLAMRDYEDSAGAVERIPLVDRVVLSDEQIDAVEVDMRRMALRLDMPRIVRGHFLMTRYGLDLMSLVPDDDVTKAFITPYLASVQELAERVKADYLHLLDGPYPPARYLPAQIPKIDDSSDQENEFQVWRKAVRIVAAAEVRHSVQYLKLTKALVLLKTNVHERGLIGAAVRAVAATPDIALGRAIKYSGLDEEVARFLQVFAENAFADTELARALFGPELPESISAAALALHKRLVPSSFQTRREIEEALPQAFVSQWKKWPDDTLSVPDIFVQKGPVRPVARDFSTFSGKPRFDDFNHEWLHQSAKMLEAGFLRAIYDGLLEHYVFDLEHAAMLDATYQRLDQRETYDKIDPNLVRAILLTGPDMPLATLNTPAEITEYFQSNRESLYKRFTDFMAEMPVYWQDPVQLAEALYAIEYDAQIRESEPSLSYVDESPSASVSEVSSEQASRPVWVSEADAHNYFLEAVGFRGLAEREEVEMPADLEARLDLIWGSRSNELSDVRDVYRFITGTDSRFTFARRAQGQLSREEVKLKVVALMQEERAERLESEYPEKSKELIIEILGYAQEFHAWRSHDLRRGALLKQVLWSWLAFAAMKDEWSRSLGPLDIHVMQAVWYSVSEEWMIELAVDLLDYRLNAADAPAAYGATILASNNMQWAYVQMLGALDYMLMRHSAGDPPGILRTQYGVGDVRITELELAKFHAARTDLISAAQALDELMAMPDPNNDNETRRNAIAPQSEVPWGFAYFNREQDGESPGFSTAEVQMFVFSEAMNAVAGGPIKSLAALTHIMEFELHRAANAMDTTALRTVPVDENRFPHPVIFGSLLDEMVAQMYDFYREIGERAEVKQRLVESYEAPRAVRDTFFVWFNIAGRGMVSRAAVSAFAYEGELKQDIFRRELPQFYTNVKPEGALTWYLLRYLLADVGSRRAGLDWETLLRSATSLKDSVERMVATYSRQTEMINLYDPNDADFERMVFALVTRPQPTRPPYALVWAGFTNNLREAFDANTFAMRSMRLRRPPPGRPADSRSRAMAGSQPLALFYQQFQELLIEESVWWKQVGRERDLLSHQVGQALPIKKWYLAIQYAIIFLNSVTRSVQVAGRNWAESRTKMAQALRSVQTFAQMTTSSPSYSPRHLDGIVREVLALIYDDWAGREGEAGFWYGTSIERVFPTVHEEMDTVVETVVSTLAHDPGAIKSPAVRDSAAAATEARIGNALPVGEMTRWVDSMNDVLQRIMQNPELHNRWTETLLRGPSDTGEGGRFTFRPNALLWTLMIEARLWGKSILQLRMLGLYVGRDPYWYEIPVVRLQHLNNVMNQYRLYLSEQLRIGPQQGTGVRARRAMYADVQLCDEYAKLVFAVQRVYDQASDTERYEWMHGMDDTANATIKLVREEVARERGHYLQLRSLGLAPGGFGELAEDIYRPSFMTWLLSGREFARVLSNDKHATRLAQKVKILEQFLTSAGSLDAVDEWTAAEPEIVASTTADPSMANALQGRLGGDAKLVMTRAPFWSSSEIVQVVDPYLPRDPVNSARIFRVLERENLVKEVLESEGLFRRAPTHYLERYHNFRTQQEREALFERKLWNLETMDARSMSDEMAFALIQEAYQYASSLNEPQLKGSFLDVENMPGIRVVAKESAYEQKFILDTVRALPKMQRERRLRLWMGHPPVVPEFQDDWNREFQDMDVPVTDLRYLEAEGDAVVPGKYTLRPWFSAGDFLRNYTNALQYMPAFRHLRAAAKANLLRLTAHLGIVWTFVPDPEYRLRPHYDYDVTKNETVGYWLGRYSMESFLSDNATATVTLATRAGKSKVDIPTRIHARAVYFEHPSMDARGQWRGMELVLDSEHDMQNRFAGVAPESVRSAKVRITLRATEPVVSLQFSFVLGDERRYDYVECENDQTLVVIQAIEPDRNHLPDVEQRIGSKNYEPHAWLAVTISEDSQGARIQGASITISRAFLRAYSIYASSEAPAQSYEQTLFRRMTYSAGQYS